MEMVCNKDMSFHDNKASKRTRIHIVRLFMIGFLAVVALAAIVLGLVLNQPTETERKAAEYVRVLQASLQNPETLSIEEIQFNPKAVAASLTEDAAESGEMMICYTVANDAGDSVRSYAVFGNGTYYGDYYPDNLENFSAVARHCVLTAWDDDENISLDLKKVLIDME